MFHQVICLQTSSDWGYKELISYFSSVRIRSKTIFLVLNGSNLHDELFCFCCFKYIKLVFVVYFNAKHQYFHTDIHFGTY